MFPTQSPHGANCVGKEGSRDSLDEVCSLFSEDWTTENIQDILAHSKSKLPRLKRGERLDGYLSRKWNTFLRKDDRNLLIGLLPTRDHCGLKKAAVKLFSARCSTIRKFLRVWQWVDTCLCLAFERETEATTSFKIKWWKIMVHDIVSSNTVHYACKKWGKFSLYLILHFGGSIQPLPIWEDWFPRLPEGTWMVKKPESLTREEKARCRLLSDKRGLPAGDKVTVGIALSSHLAALTKGDTLSPSQEADLVMYSGMAAQSIKDNLKDNWFKEKTGHISLSNSACFENTREEGGKRLYILKALRKWLEESPTQSRNVTIPTGESYVEEEGIPRWKTVKPPGFSTPTDIPSGKRISTGILTDDFADGEQERVGFQLFCWAFSVLVEDGYLDHNGQATEKPMPISRIAIGEPGCKVRVATRSQAAFIVYGQPFAHAMRELLESHPALRAGLGSGYQLFEWIKGVEDIPQHVMIGDYDSATDHIQHRAGRLAMHKLLATINADKNGYAKNYVDLLLSPRVIEEDGVVTVTNSGCLMGEPGTKIVLTFLALVANCYARRGPPSKYFATAGDDQIDADNSPEELLRYAEASKVTTMVPSTEKWGIFRYSALYCQQLLDIQCESKRTAEIAVPKPRLLSPETKSGRGDEDTNPAYGKSSQFAKECEWCDFIDIKRSMVVLFLRNMRQYIEPKIELFIPREWGGLGLPGVKPGELLRDLPEWHQKLVEHRESGCPDARKVLAAWSTTRIFHRGLLEPETNLFDDLLNEFLPTAHIGQIELVGVSPDARYREKLKAAKAEGWIPMAEVLNAVKESQTYENIWDISIPTNRGFSSVPWSKRFDRLRKISKRFAPIELKVHTVPSWQPGTLTLVHGFFGLSELDGDEWEDGEINANRSKIVPLMGTFASPRVFLHYDNCRLILNTTSRKRNSN